MFVCLPDFFSKSAQCETIVKITLDSVSDSSIWNVSIFPEYNNIGSDIKELLSSNKPLKISTLSLTTFSLRQVDINVWSAPDKAKFKLVFVTSVSSVNDGTETKNGLAVYVLLEPDIDEVVINEEVITKGSKPILVHEKKTKEIKSSI